MERPWDHTSKGISWRIVSLGTVVLTLLSSRAWVGNITKCMSQNRIYFSSSKS